MYCPLHVLYISQVTQYRSTIQLIIKDNQFEAMSMLMVGEGYKSDMMLSNIKRRASERFIEVEQLSDGNDGNTCL